MYSFVFQAYVSAFKPANKFSFQDFIRLHSQVFEIWHRDRDSLVLLSVESPPLLPPTAAVPDIIRAERVAAQQEMNRLLQQTVADNAARMKHGSQVSFRNLANLRSVFTGLRTSDGVTIAPPIPSRHKVAASTAALLESGIIQRMHVLETDGLHWARMPLMQCMKLNFLLLLLCFASHPSFYMFLLPRHSTCVAPFSGGSYADRGAQTVQADACDLDRFHHAFSRPASNLCTRVSAGP
jgi:hypothetical protein